MKRIYLSGSMTGLPGLNFPDFFSMAAKLPAAGHGLVTPAEIGHHSDEWPDCLHRHHSADAFRRYCPAPWLEKLEGASSKLILPANFV